MNRIIELDWNQTVTNLVTETNLLPKEGRVGGTSKTRAKSATNILFGSSYINMILKAIMNSSKYVNESTADVVMINLNHERCAFYFYLLTGGGPAG